MRTLNLLKAEPPKLVPVRNVKAKKKESLNSMTTTREIEESVLDSLIQALGLLGVWSREVEGPATLLSLVLVGANRKAQR